MGSDEKEKPPWIYNYMNVRRWTKKVRGLIMYATFFDYYNQFDIFAMDKIFIPVNLNQAHWCLAVIFIQEQKIQYYDSMNGRGILCIKNIHFHRI